MRQKGREDRRMKTEERRAFIINFLYYAIWLMIDRYEQDAELLGQLEAGYYQIN